MSAQHSLGGTGRFRLYVQQAGDAGYDPTRSWRSDFVPAIDDVLVLSDGRAIVMGREIGVVAATGTSNTGLDADAPQSIGLVIEYLQ